MDKCLNRVLAFIRNFLSPLPGEAEEGKEKKKTRRSQSYFKGEKEWLKAK
jgi:hypothetical protein